MIKQVFTQHRGNAWEDDREFPSCLIAVTIRYNKFNHLFAP
jgi:hypothetical protein